jgi:hypothetical protein
MKNNGVEIDEVQVAEVFQNLSAALEAPDSQFVM